MSKTIFPNQFDVNLKEHRDKKFETVIQELLCHANVKVTMDTYV